MSFWKDQHLLDFQRTLAFLRVLSKYLDARPNFSEFEARAFGFGMGDNRPQFWPSGERQEDSAGQSVLTHSAHG